MKQQPQVPSPSDPAVQKLIALHQLAGPAEYVQYQDFGYEARFCHVSSKHRAEVAGGRRVHGWAIWRWSDASGNGAVLLAEHHSVWETPTGTLVDVTPTPGQTDRVLFVRDDRADIVLVGREFLLRTDLTDIAPEVRVLQGNPVEFDFYPVDVNKVDLAAYCERIAFKPENMATDPELG